MLADKELKAKQDAAAAVKAVEEVAAVAAESKAEEGAAEKEASAAPVDGEAAAADGGVSTVDEADGGTQASLEGALTNAAANGVPQDVEMEDAPPVNCFAYIDQSVVFLAIVEGCRTTQETPVLPPLEMPASPVSPAAAMSPVSPEPVVKVVFTKSEPAENPAEAAKPARVRVRLKLITICKCYIVVRNFAVAFI